MSYLTVYVKDNVYYYETVSCCTHEIGYINGLGRELIDIEIYYNGRYYSFEEHEIIWNNRELKNKKFKRRYKIFKNILYLLS